MTESLDESLFHVVQLVPRFEVLWLKLMLLQIKTNFFKRFNQIRELVLHGLFVSRFLHENNLDDFVIGPEHLI